MAEKHYLTVPDFVWLNFDLTGKHNGYRFDKLEEAVNAQYAYGKAPAASAQVIKFAESWTNLKPFSHGNTACAFVGAVAFLRANGFDFAMPDSKLVTVLDKEVPLPWSDPKIVRAMAHPPHHIDTKELLLSVKNEFAGTVAALLASEDEQDFRSLENIRLTGELIKQ